VCGKCEGKGMKRNSIVLFVAVNVLILVFGGFLAYSDLYIRKDTSRNHENTTLIDVEYSLLAYRPTYQYTEIINYEPAYIVVTEGSWTLDFFQLSIIVMAIVDLLWLLYIRQKKVGISTSY
jgi:hypothetical protein